MFLVLMSPSIYGIASPIFIDFSCLEDNIYEH